MIEIEGKTFPVQDYFLEDIIQLIHFQGNQSFTNQRRSASKQRPYVDDDDDELVEDDSPTDDTEVRSSLFFFDFPSVPFSGDQLQQDLFERLFSTDGIGDESTERENSLLRIDRGKKRRTSPRCQNSVRLASSGVDQLHLQFGRRWRHSGLSARMEFDPSVAQIFPPTSEIQ